MNKMLQVDSLDFETNYKLESLVTQESGREIDKKAIFSPQGNLIDVVNDNYTMVEPSTLVKEFDSILTEMSIPVSSKELFVSEKDMSEIEIDYKTTIQEEIVYDDNVEFGFNLNIDMSSGGVNFNILSWRQVCSNGLVAFVPTVSVRRGASKVVTSDMIMTSIKSAMSQWQTGIQRYRRMSTENINQDEALSRVGSLKVGKEELETSIQVVEEEFGKKGGHEITQWEFFNALMFVSTHLLARHRRSQFNKRVESDFMKGRSICYHGTPHTHIAR